MDTTHALSIRNKIVGALVRRARLRSGLTQTQAAAVLGCSAAEFDRHERGEVGLSLPQLEVLAYLFNVPLRALFDEDSVLPGGPSDPDELPLHQILQLRRRIIGVQLRKARESVGLTVAEVAQILDCSPETVVDYELGQKEISLAELELVAAECGLSLSAFSEDDTRPISATELDSRVLARAAELPPEMREFALNPTNDLYLRIGMKLHSLDADTLRQIAEALLDITY
jgi:transcriptional regulator with XRE-family HTH domain